MTTTPRFLMTRIVAGTAAEQPHNEALNVLDAVVCCTVINRSTASPPSGSDGDAYIVPVGATGLWLDLDGQVVVYYSGQWLAIPPATGMTVYIQDEQVIAIYDSAWRTVTYESIIQLARITSNVALANTPSWTAATWNSQIKYNANSIYTHSTSSNTDQITLGEAGEYEVQVDAAILGSGTAGATRCDAKLTLNGSDVTSSFASCYVDSSSMLRQTISLNMVVVASAGDILRVEMQRAAGSGTVNLIAGYSRVRIRKIA